MPTIYIDMDGVVADFIAATRKFIKSTPEEAAQAAQTGRLTDEHWAQLTQYSHFYRDLPLMPRARDMMDLAMRFRDTFGWRLRMLTAIPHDNDFPECFQDKMDWMSIHFPGVRVCFGPYSRDKARHCQPGDILVDDLPSNIEQWRHAGGIAIQVTSDYELALVELRSIFDTMLKERNSPSDAKREALAP